MMGKKRVVALLPLLGDGKTIANGLVQLAGRPLCHYSIAAVKNSKLVDDVYIITDSADVRATAASLDGSIKFSEPPADMAWQECLEDIMVHFLNKHEADILITLNVSTPLTSTRDIESALQQFAEDKNDLLFTGVRCDKPLWSNGKPLAKRNIIIENGAFVIASKDAWSKDKGKESSGIYEMDPISSLELLTYNDMERAETILRSVDDIDLSRIKIIVADVDGTMTDAGMYYSGEGEELKKFCTRDAFGMKKAQKVGIDIILITGENTGIVTARAKKIGIKEVHLGIQDKKSVLELIMAERKLSADQVAFIGDDENDLACIELAGFSGCPADALPLVKRKAKFVSTLNGGQGAVREFIEAILAVKRS